MTLGSAAAAGVRLILWCWDCRHQVEPDPANGSSVRRRDWGCGALHPATVCSLGAFMASAHHIGCR
jgi:hypothetical protein